MSNSDSELDPEMTSRQKREANLGVVLISISILFIICQSVKIIPDLYEVAWCSNRHNILHNKGCPASTKQVLNNLADFSHLLLAINSSANFIIYTWRGEKERKSLLLEQIFKGWISKGVVKTMDDPQR